MTGGPPIDLAIVLAGGGGTRLWPWTGTDRPKPLLPLGGGGRTLLAATLDRLEGVVGAGRIRLQAPSDLGARLVATDDRLGAERLDGEPSARDTAPAVALAMARARRARSDAIVAILPADHRVEDEPAFRESLARAASAAAAGGLVVLAVPPTGPSTRFGYVQCAAPPARGPGGAVRVRRFVEKPDAAGARELLERGDSFWNAGIFVWRADVFWSALELAAPDVAGPVDAYLSDGGAPAWERATTTSIDYALMERADGVVAVPLDAGWDDVGSWDAVCRIAEQGDAGGAVRVDVAGDAADGSMVLEVGDGKIPRAVVLGDRPMLVVHGPEGLLVTPRADADRVKGFIG
ncbi:MAG: sugar phosphate nucleotidyltransferase [Acidobacteriota bacterium]|nr:sugar phosphate nucleotidyltransferase [Acidobacteriota bacterium]